MGKIKTLKKFRKQARVTASEIFPTILRPRPWWMPKIVWRAMFRLFFK